ncbi:MAG: murein biosynthesis integral membrane protein MurJ, partial [Halobacteriovoraceae bacterium]|nr:murein biosynthesis integral membrane protein MurJ [Halobacteriovoraceae bacterium]
MQNNSADIAEQKSSRRSLIGASLKMGMATLSSRILGLVREQVMAYTFGASGWTDAFNVAFRVPNMLRDLFAEGSFSSAFVPIFTEVKLEDPEKAKRLLWSMVVLLGGITTIISFGILVFAPQLVQFFTDARFTSDPERFQLTTTLIRIMSPFLVFVSLAALFMGVLNTLKIFFVPALAPAFFNLVMIASILTMPAILKARGIHPVLALGIG